MTVPSALSQHLNFCTFILLLPTACFFHLFDHHQVNKNAFFLFVPAFILPDDEQMNDRNM